jgi:acyl carrier protein
LPEKTHGSSSVVIECPARPLSNQYMMNHMRNLQFQTNSGTSVTAKDKVKEIAADIFQLDAADIDLAMGPDDIDAWDSLNHLRLITAVESAFSLHLSMQQIQNIHSLADLVNFVAVAID